MRKNLRTAAVLAFIVPYAWLLSACTARTVSTPAPAGGQAPSALAVTSPAFAADAGIPAKYTCQGDNISPALDWSAPPAGTKSLALVVEDPDAPGGTFIHWVVYNIPAEARGLAENASKAGLPEGAVQGKTSFRRAEYGGPCPPSGTHHYHFKVFALDTTLPQSAAGEELDRSGLVKAIDHHVLAQGDLIGLYAKK